MCKKFEWLLSAAILMCGAPVAFAQPPDFPPGGFGGRGPGGPGGMGQHVKIVERATIADRLANHDGQDKARQSTK